MNEATIQKALYWRARGANCILCIPGAMLLLDGEQDFLQVTTSGYVHEFEIKLTRADFKADFKKTSWGKWKKHELLSGTVEPPWRMTNERDGILLPRMFWFVAPTGLLFAEDTPEHAGLLEFDGEKRYDPFTVAKRGRPIKGARKLTAKECRRFSRSMGIRMGDLWAHDAAPWVVADGPAQATNNSNGVL